MLFISILILIIVMAISSLKEQIHPIIFQRISSIILIYAGALSFNGLYIQSIGSGIGIYSGLFHVTVISQFLDGILFMLGAFILMALSSCFILLGAGLIYTFTGLTNFDSIYSLISVSYTGPNKIMSGVSLGVMLIFIGFLFKIAAAPFHSLSTNKWPSYISIDSAELIHSIIIV